MSRREKWSIVGAILSALDAETKRGGPARLTNVASRANIAYDRLQAYLLDLQKNGLVTMDGAAQLTPKGREFLQHYRRWVELLDRFGIANPETDRKRAREGGPGPTATGAPHDASAGGSRS